MLEIRNVSKIYGQDENRITALDRVSLTVNRGDFIAIMGPSGSGKSTLLNIIGGLERLSEGKVILEGKRIDNLHEDELVNARREKIAYVFQQFHLLPSLTALENVLLPLVFAEKEANEDRARELLNKVGLGKRLGHSPAQLSGGEQQRVAIARAMINQPALVLADEPTGNMDQETGKEILGLFQQLNRNGCAIVMVTHDPDITRHAREIVFLRDGRIVDRTASDAYRQSLVGSSNKGD